MMEGSQGYNTDFIIQSSLVGLVLLGACIWIIWKLFKKNKNAGTHSCCGCSQSDTCEKIKLLHLKENKNHGNLKDLQQQHCRQSDTTDY